MVAGGKGGLAEGCDGEILFFGVGAEGWDLVGFLERCYGAFDGFDCLAGEGCAGCLTCDWRNG